MNIKSSIIIFSFSLIVFIIACGNKKNKNNTIAFSFINITENQKVSRPLPLVVKGKITNYDSLPKDVKSKLYVYLIEQSTKERIWHIEPKVSVDDQGNFRGLTWLGNSWQGKWSTFNICVFAVNSPLKLNNGDHPVKVKPMHMGEKCIQIKRHY